MSSPRNENMELHSLELRSSRVEPKTFKVPVYGQLTRRDCQSAFHDWHLEGMIKSCSCGLIDWDIMDV